MKFLKRKQATSKNSNRIIIGGLTLPIFYALFSLLACTVCYLGKNPTANTDIASLAALLATGCFGTLFISIVSKGASVLFPIASSLSFAALIITASLIVNGRIGYGCIMNTLCFVLISLFTAFCAKFIKRGKKNVKRHF